MQPRASEFVLEVSGLHTGYGDLMVLSGLDLTVIPGKTTVLLGPNGAGKTTLMRAIAGTLPIVKGEVRLDGRVLNSVPTHARLREAAWVPEGRLLFSDFTVRDNLFLSARAADAARHFPDALAECIDLFPVLRDKLSSTAGSLSGGQQQMVAIARAIVRRPRLLLLDEPSMGLAPLVLRDIRRALEQLQGSGMSVLVAEQNVPWLEGIVDSVVVLGGGKAVVSGGEEILRDREAVRAVYLGT